MSLIKFKNTKEVSQYKDIVFDSIGIPVIKIRRSHDRLIFIMEIHIFILKQALYLNQGSGK